MLKLNNYNHSFLISLVLHVLVLSFLVISFGALTPAFKSAPQVDIVKAVVVNQQDLDSEIAKIQSEKNQQKKREEEKIIAAKEKQKLEEQKLEKLKKAEEEHTKAIALAKRKATEQEALAKKKQEELAALEKKIATQKATEEQLSLKKRKAELEKALNEEMKSEKEVLSEAAQTKINNEVDKYKAIIISAISRSWLVPPQANKNLSCQLLVKIGPGGVVLDVQTLKSSGDAVLDRSAKTAVLKASPLPVPTKPELFDKFRELKLTVRPEKIVSR